MKIVTWNCNGGFRNKTKSIDELDADILVVQECEDPSKSTVEYKIWAKNYLWLGDNKNKGIGIFVKDGITIEKLNWSDENINYKNEKLESFLPCVINEKYILIAIWTKKANSDVFGYIGQFWKYLQLHKNKMIGKSLILLGDLNSNSIWDKWDRWWNHTDVINELEEIKVNSLYHKLNIEKHGEERLPTFFMQRKSEKPYHIDYVFLSDNISKDATLKIGEKEIWLKLSDHLPLICSIEDNEKS